MKGSVLPDLVSGNAVSPVTGLLLLTRQSLDEATPFLFSFSCSLQFSGLRGDTSQAPAAHESASPVGVVAWCWDAANPGRVRLVHSRRSRGHVCCHPWKSCC